jgi:hypothetical protein
LGAGAFLTFGGSTAEASTSGSQPATDLDLVDQK